MTVPGNTPGLLSPSEPKLETWNTQALRLPPLACQAKLRCCQAKGGPRKGVPAEADFPDAQVETNMGGEEMWDKCAGDNKTFGYLLGTLFNDRGQL